MEHSQIKHVFVFILAPIFLLALFTPNLTLAAPLVPAPVKLAVVDIGFCYPNITLSSDSKIHVKRGTVLKFACQVINQGSVANVSLVGERIKDGSSDKPSSVSALISLPKQGGIVSVLIFPMILQNGSYRHTFSLKNPSDGKTIGRQLVFNVVLDSPVVKINSIEFDKKSYSSNETARITLTVSLPLGSTTTVPFKFDLETKNSVGTTCSYAILGKPILNVKETHAMRFLEGKVGCDVSSLLLTVKTKEGIPVDNQSVVLSLTSSSSNSYSIWQDIVNTFQWNTRVGNFELPTGRIIIGILLLLILGLGYNFWRRNHYVAVETTKEPGNEENITKT